MHNDLKERVAAPAATTPPDASKHALEAISASHGLAGEGRWRDAEARLREAISLDPVLPMAYNNLGWVLEAQNDPDGAAHCYRSALALNPALTLSRSNLIALLNKRGCVDETASLAAALVDADDVDPETISLGIEASLKAGCLTLAGNLADRYGRSRRGSRWHARRGAFPPSVTPVPVLTAAKLRHDIEQLRYLRARELIDREFDEVIARHELVLETVASRGEGARVELSGHARALIGDVYGRIVFRPETPRLAGRALSPSWDPAAIEAAFLDGSEKFVVVDDFLCGEALAEVRRFCLQSTVWFKNSYGHGRLGAFLRDGFNSPLLLQVAEELQAALPRTIGARHPLLQLWAFKNSRFQPPTSSHADFAAVNVNFWITPEEANLDPQTGGLMIYDVEAPPDWEFDLYNKDGQRIEGFLAERRARATVIPYRANRMILFKSDLFHKTAPLNFQDGYENRRINVTMLYGRREAAPPS